MVFADTLLSLFVPGVKKTPFLFWDSHDRVYVLLTTVQTLPSQISEHVPRSMLPPSTVGQCFSPNSYGYLVLMPASSSAGAHCLRNTALPYRVWALAEHVVLKRVKTAFASHWLD